MSENTALLHYTGYYKGEKQCPESCPHPNIWTYEKMWVEKEEERDENDGRVREYKQDVLPLYNEDDGIPLTLKALLYNRYSHWVGGYSLESDVRGFVKFLNQHYLGNDTDDR